MAIPMTKLQFCALFEPILLVMAKKIYANAGGDFGERDLRLSPHPDDQVNAIATLVLGGMDKSEGLLITKSMVEDAVHYDAARKFLQEAANRELTVHASDCAVHNAPALPVGSCDCGAEG